MKTKRVYYYIMLISYLAGIHHGKIALWKGEDPEPVAVLPYSVQMLPEADRTALEHGIAIRSEEELVRFMEDFCS